ncbi:hypothetical protein C7S15_3966 [Burkholderia cepacia]|nr:hypothetical protein [Burkholderia cepacia]
MKYRRELILRSIRISNSRTLTGDMVIVLHRVPLRLARQGIRPAPAGTLRRQSGQVPNDGKSP